MEQNGEYLIAAGRQQVWEALNDPEVLRQCIAGCLSMDKVSEHEFHSKVKAKIGPVSATFTANLELSEVRPAQGYQITANVKGGPAGFGKGTALVDLTDGSVPDSTLLTYKVDASVGGKLAQIGSRLIDGAARKMADDFFGEFGQLVGGVSPESAAGSQIVTPGSSPPSAAEDAAQAMADSAGQPTPRESGPSWIIWALVFGALAIALTAAL